MRPTSALRQARLPLVDDLAGHGDRMAVVDGSGTLTYAAMAAEVAAATARLGGTRRLVVVEVANERDPVLWYLAALAGGHPVVLAPADAPAAVAALVAAYDPDVVVGRGAHGWEAAERRPGSAHRLHPDLALLLSTSGSTGSPKLVRLSHANLQSNADAIARFLGLRPDDRAITSLPLHYCYGLSLLHSHLAVGGGVVLTGASVVDPCFWQTFRSAGATTLAGVPHTFELLDRVDFAAMAPPTLRRVTQAGGRLAPDAVRRYAELGAAQGWELFVMYGQTEATARMAYLPPHLAATAPGAVGVAIPGGSLHLEPVPELDAADGVGELVYEGPNVMLGYAERPADLALGRTVEVLRTGDLARQTEDGLFEVTGRRSRFLKLFGLRVDLAKVEADLAAHGVEAMCTGDDTELVVAVAGSPGADHVTRLVRRTVALPAGAVRVCPVPALPRLSNGKPDHPAVRRLVGEAVPPTRLGPGRRTVREVYAEVLGRSDVTSSSTFVSLGGDSLSYVEVSVALEDALGHLPPGWHVRTVGELERVVTGRRRGKQVETNVVLRAVAILMVVGSHATLFERRGGAHVLLAIAGFNFARFSLGGEGHPTAPGRMVAAAARVALPAACWIAVLVAVTDDYSIPSIFLLNGHLGSLEFDERWRYWFVEALVQSVLIAAAAFSVPAVRRLERRHAFPFALGVLAIGLATRYGLVELLDARHRTVQTQTVFWVFALGWAAQRAATAPQRLLVSALAVASVRGFFFDEPVREAIVAAGVLALVWLPHLPVPRPLDRILAPVAAASLATYLTHWHVFPALLPRTSPLVAVVASVVVGLAAWAVVQRATRVVELALTRLAGAGRSGAARRRAAAVSSAEATGSGTPRRPVGALHPRYPRYPRQEWNRRAR